jgi:hypothetical protein
LIIPLAKKISFGYNRIMGEKRFSYTARLVSVKIHRNGDSELVYIGDT